MQKKKQRNIKTKVIKKRKYQEPSLLQKIINRQPTPTPTLPQQPIQANTIKQCIYGVLCAHLRSTGNCPFPHPKNHYLFLNIVPPTDCLQAKQQTESMSKSQKKQNKLIEKVISEKIDLGQIERRREQQIRMRQFNQMNDREKFVFELVSSKDLGDYFTKWLSLAVGKRLPEMLQIKSKSLFQLKKKNESMYSEIITKEYQMGQALKQKSDSSKNHVNYQIYLDLSIEEEITFYDYHQQYKRSVALIQDQSEEIKVRKQARTIKKQRRRFSQFFLKEEDSSNSPLLTICTPHPQRIYNNTAYLNLIVPHSLTTNTSSIKYIYLDCSQQVTFNTITDKICQDYLATFNLKCKPNTYNFGQLQANKPKYISWMSKIYKKYEESSMKIVLVIANGLSIPFDGLGVSEFGLQKWKQSSSVMSGLLRIWKKGAVVVLMKDLSERDHYVRLLSVWLGEQGRQFVNLNQIAEE